MAKSQQTFMTTKKKKKNTINRLSLSLFARNKVYRMKNNDGNEYCMQIYLEQYKY